MTNLKNYGRLDNRYFRLKLAKISSYINDSVLDIGGYTGELKQFLNPLIDYYLIDKDEEALALARLKGINVYSLDLNNSDIPNYFGRCDTVVISDILDLVIDADKVLGEAVKLSTNKVIISVTNDNTIYHRFRVLFGLGINANPFNLHYHLRHPTFKQWEKFIDKYVTRKQVSYTNW